MASMASIGSLKVPSSPSTATTSSNSNNHSRRSVVKRLAFSSSQLSGDKIFSKAVTGDRRSERRPIVVSPQAVSDSKNSQTCLDPEASRSVLGIILGGGAGTRLYPLTKKRAKPAVPLGANYRLIDIPVSNCLNSNISKIYVLTQFNSASLNRHLSRAYAKQLKAMKVDTTILGLDDERAKEMPYIASMGIYVISKDVMLNLLRDKFPGANDFGSEVIPGATSIGMRVQAYLYDGYWEDIGTIEAFYNANLGITKKPIPDFSFYDRSAPIYTQPRYLPPSKMLDADVTDSVIGEGCVIKNCKIHHSVVGLRSCISEGAIIEDTLLMGADYYETDADRRFLAAKGSVPIGIGKNSHIKRAIIDKNARIGDNVKIVNSDSVQEAARETDGYFIKSGIVTIIKDALIPSGTII
ncbi:hypothetical protein CISIN_1g009971mg [Citrus sinensis]|uniref:glucose-1-phosphate adenylyltransferase n=1 Tax=Citrus sinensis TaxID=2711 RepID=A0A067DST6_CITSI|nr:hypothetical protein CISIN_1g009971mg [Citrus sinensis]